MDRSFLSDARVIAASRNFVCIRLATYEDQKEADFLKTVFLPGSGLLENTTFAVLSPDGKRQLVRAGRGPQHAWRRASDMAAGMTGIAEEFPKAKAAFGSDPGLPLMEDVRVAMNVAACDHLPLVVVHGKDRESLKKLTALLQPVVWSRSMAGQFVFAESSHPAALKRVRGRKLDSGILILRPDAFGASSEVLHEFKPDSSRRQIEMGFAEVVADYEPDVLDFRTHLQLGIELGVDWKTEIPETDLQSVRARQRARGNR